MTWTLRAVVSTTLLLGTPLFHASCASAPKHSTLLPETWTDVTGTRREPLHTSDRPATVLLFVAPDCPISNGYAPEIARIASTYELKGVAFFAVHADPRVSAESARRHATEYGYDFPVLLDPQQTLARRVGATVTPEAAVLDGAGEVVYLGRIDDRYYSFGKRRENPTRQELRDALDAVLQGHPVAAASAPPIGCEIPPPLSR
jgi:thiol-disulfide isomerase/thioredoxin